MVYSSSYCYYTFIAGLILLGWCEIAVSFNIDIQPPLTVHYSPALGIDANDLFGYKIVLFTDTGSGITR